MISKQHRQNTDFQLAYFLASSCSTPDGAWSLMYGQRLSVENALEAGKAQRLDIHIKRLKAERVLSGSTDEIERLEAERDIIEANSAERMLDLNERGAREELATIEKLMAKLQPLCQHDTSDPHAQQEAAQWDEWLGEFLRRCENKLISNAIGIAPDEIDAMRAHPDFTSKILPHIMAVGSALADASRTQDPKLLAQVLSCSPALSFADALKLTKD